ARLYGYGRFGNTGNLYQNYLGYPFLIRGYEAQTFYNGNGRTPTNNFTIDQLSGNNIAVANFEVRLPFTGPERLSKFKSKFLFTELNLFFDAGLAWNSGDKVEFKSNPTIEGTKTVVDGNGNPVLDASGNPVKATVYSRIPVTSAGISIRVNVFGYFVLE